MIVPELIEFSVSNAEQGLKVARAVQRIVKKLSANNLLEIDAAMQKDPQIIPKVLRIAENPVVRRLFQSMKPS